MAGLNTTSVVGFPLGTSDPFPSIGPMRKRTFRFASTFVAILTILGAPDPAAAQFGALEAFARKVTDLSFYFNAGDLFSGGDELRTDDGGLRQFGVELLFSVGSVDRVTGPAPTQADSARLVWTEMVVVKGDDGSIDTTYVYEVRPAPTPGPPTESVWFFEMGFGYGQMSGFESVDPSLDLRGSIRDLPAVSLYASYEPWGTYVGLRTGYQKLQSLQVFDENGTSFKGRAENFFAGALVGYAKEFAGLNLFVEAALGVRDFTSVEWSGPIGTQPPGTLPREMALSGWTIGTGLQFPLGN